MYFVWTYPKGDSVRLFEGTLDECRAFVERETLDNPSMDNIMSYHFQLSDWI